MRRHSRAWLVSALLLAACASPKETERTSENELPPAASSFGALRAELERITTDAAPSEVTPDFDAGGRLVAAAPAIGSDTYVLGLWRDADDRYWVVEMGGIDGRGRHCFGPFEREGDRLLPLAP